MKPWVEKYRPDNIQDIAHHDEISNVLKESIQTGNLPHTIFHGSPGTGKTSTIRAFTRMVFPKNMNEYVLELNASDERCINTVRLKIKAFSKRATTFKSTCKFKIVILDEADTMTPDAQSALRRIMEDYSHSTRFCLICNYISKIMSPLLSRCSTFRFSDIPAHVMVTRLRYIATHENVDIRNSTLMRISELSKGDMRRGIFNLQMVSTLNMDKEISIDMINSICGEIDNQLIIKLWETVGKRNFRGSREFVKEFISSGFPVSSLLYHISKHIVDHDIDDKSKSKICKSISVVECNLIAGCGEYIQLLEIVGVLCNNL